MIPPILMRLLLIIGFCGITSGFGIVTFITISLFFKKQVCFHEKNKVILCAELFLDLCGWMFLGALVTILLFGGNW